jgi:hypothetical protein
MASEEGVTIATDRILAFPGKCKREVISNGKSGQP